MDDLLKDNRVQLDRLLDLYIIGDFPKDVLTERKYQLGEIIAGFERERTSIMVRLDNMVKAEQEQAIRGLAGKIGNRLSIASDRFDIRRQIIELLDVTAILSIEDGKKVARVSCVLDDAVLEVISNRKKGKPGGGESLLSMSNSTVMESQYLFERVEKLTNDVQFGSSMHRGTNHLIDIPLI